MNINLPLTERMFARWAAAKSISKNDESRIGV